MEEIKNVAKISQSNAEKIKGKEYAPGQTFNPIEDGEGKWIITLYESQFLDRDEINFQITKWIAPKSEDEI